MEQIVRISWMNLKNITSRWTVALVIVVGIGGVVGVLTALLAMAEGFSSALASGGAPDRAIVMRDGSTGEMESDVSVEAAAIFADLPGILFSSAESYTIADVPKKATGTTANLILRGVTESAFAVRPEVEIVEGRNFETGRNEVIVGVTANYEFANLDVGDVVDFRQTEWRVVGLFEANGSAYESEVWLDYPVAISAFRRFNPSTLRVRLESSDALGTLEQTIKDDPRLNLSIQSEEAFLSGQSSGLTQRIEIFAYIVASTMAIGALFAALNTMYTAVSTRTVEIATLRAIGFNGTPVVVSVMLESIVLAAIGGVLGGIVAFIAFNGFTVSTLNPSAFSQIGFDFVVTPEMLIGGFAWAVVIGSLGGLFPAIKAATLPITVALRGE